MNRRTSLAHAVLVAGVALLAPAADAVVITDPVEAPAEGCNVTLAGYFPAPPELLDCLQDCLPLCRANALYCEGCPDPNCGRLIPTLRNAAQTRDASEILVRAATEFYRVRHPELGSTSRPVAQALADLAVTGRAAYASFRRSTPSEAALMGSLGQRLLAMFPTHQQVLSDIREAVLRTLSRSYQVAWALRGPTAYRNSHRARLQWIAVAGEDDPPHRPVNVSSAPFPQYGMTVRVGTTEVETRYMVASRAIRDDHSVAVDTVPPDRPHPLIIGDVVVFIPGHSSSAEEAVALADSLLAHAASRGRPVTLIAMDLPSNGYASMIEHTTIAPSDASLWNVGYPILDFIERFVIAFVDGLEMRQPGIKRQITGVIGGSLGGNMGLRLGRRDPTVYPWLRNIVSWSPASAWDSWDRAVLVYPPPRGRFYDFTKYNAVRVTRGRMDEEETPRSLHLLFHNREGGVIGTGRVAQAGRWYSEWWPCRTAAITGSHRGIYEIYNARFRRWHWRVAHEQLIFSHWDSDNPDPAVDPDPRNDSAAGPARYSQIRARLLLAAGYNDDAELERLFTETRQLARSMTMVNGAAFFIKDTGHSIHAERPAFFADRILTFLYQSPPPPFPAFLVPAVGF